LGLVFLFLQGCATPKPVLSLTEKTAANVVTVQSEMEKFSAERSKLYLGRVENNQAMMQNLAEARQKLSGLEESMELSGEKEKLKAYRGVIAASDKALANRNAVTAQLATRRQEAIAAYTKIQTSSESLSALTKMLDALANELTPEEQLKFYSEFSSQTYSKYQELNRAKTEKP
jgi:hypothetical protein